jgi:adenylate cyclase class IV
MPRLCHAGAPKPQRPAHRPPQANGDQPAGDQRPTTGDAPILHRNLELKARDPDPARSLAACLRLGAEDRGLIEQRDTYFDVASGRLKLREEDPGEPHLIFYVRADTPTTRESRYRIAPVADATATRTVLGAALVVAGTVAKRRRLLLWQGVRIHLDEVAGEGTFVELEAVDMAPGPAADRIAHLRRALAITDERLVSRGYLSST